MSYWRMAFRVGSQGYEMWPDCRAREIAAIGYYTEKGDPVVKDCSKLTEDQYDEIWRDKDPRNSAGRSSLRNLAYRMKAGDVIFVKEGPYIVGRGRVRSPYEYDPRILGGTEAEWEHFVRVEWDAIFTPVRITLGAEPLTVLHLTGERLQRLQVTLDLDSLEAEESYFEEGGKKKHFTNHYERNSRLCAKAIVCHGTKCRICGFDFETVYGERGAGYIEVHHLRPVSKLDNKTLVDPETDMTVVCSNCHRMIHRSNGDVLSPSEVVMILQSHS